LILAAFLAIEITLQWSQPIDQFVDLIELNHKYAADGKHTFSQVIFWQRLPQNGKYRVREWVIPDDRESLSSFPVKRHGLYESQFVKNGIYYRVRSPLFRESWTMKDPEVEDGKIHPKHTRVPFPKNRFSENDTKEE